MPFQRRVSSHPVAIVGEIRSREIAWSDPSCATAVISGDETSRSRSALVPGGGQWGAPPASNAASMRRQRVAGSRRPSDAAMSSKRCRCGESASHSNTSTSGGRSASRAQPSITAESKPLTCIFKTSGRRSSRARPARRRLSSAAGRDWNSSSRCRRRRNSVRRSRAVA